MQFNNDLYEKLRKRYISKKILLLNFVKTIMTKGVMSNDEINDIKKQINEYMYGNCRKSHKSNVCVAINIFNSIENKSITLPNVESIAKNIIDIIYLNKQKEHSAANADCVASRFPIYDDSQITILCVRNHEMEEGFPSNTYVYISSERNFYEAIDFVSVDEESDNQKDIPDIRDISDLKQVQELITSNTAISIRMLKLIKYYAKVNPGILLTLFENSTFFRFDNSMKQTKKRKDDFEFALSKFISEFPILKSIKGGIIITVYQIGHSIDNQDIDNLMLSLICPIFRKVFKDKNIRDIYDFNILGYDIIRIKVNDDAINQNICFLTFHMNWDNNFVTEVFDKIGDA